MPYPKHYLRIQVIFDPDGDLTPVCFEWHGGRVDIDRVLSAELRAPKHVGLDGSCLEYRCMIYGQVRQLYLEMGETNRWFIEVSEEVERDPDPDMM